MEIEIGYDRFEDIKRHAYWTNVHIDTRFRADRENMDDYIAHLKDCENHPTTGLLAKRKYITGKKKNYSVYARRNLHILERQPEADKLLTGTKEKIDRLYPKTKHIRQYVIDHDRVLLDWVEKTKKYTFGNKLAIMLRKII